MSLFSQFCGYPTAIDYSLPDGIEVGSHYLRSPHFASAFAEGQL